MYDVPSDLKYTKEHEWVRISGSKATIGITDYAQKQLGDIVFVELPNVDEEIDAGDEFGTVESVKSVSPIFQPMSGKTVDINTELNDQPELINEDCYGEGWLVRVEITNPAEVDSLMSAEEYKAFLEEAEEE